ncbi:hypothetical protein Taro_025087 [Colocasia esculenta]|uniref:Protein kinase domain-containing protein n=1 Tax=Colocasia esculenta TaxID=4460 RepID=A0A843VJG1_COLES|nr:hypothetical protein [Colocasia esculenta]
MQSSTHQDRAASTSWIHAVLLLQPMEKLRQIGEVMGSLRGLMVFQEEIRINRSQCVLLVDALNLAFEVITDEIKHTLSFDERLTPKWKALEHPLQELHRICRDAEEYLRQCMEPRSWWIAALTLGHSADCVELHLHSLLWCVPVVLEAVEAAGEIAGRDQDSMHRRRVAVSKKYEKEWLDPALFQHQYGRQHLVNRHLCGRMDAARREDRWALLDMIAEKKASAKTTVLSKQELRLADLVAGSKEKLFPSRVMVASKDYQVKRRLGSGSHYKEVQWMGESFAVRHFFGDIEPLVPEILKLAALAHPNVLPLFCAFSDDERKECFLLTELMQRTLCSHIKESCGPRRRAPFPLPVVVDVMLQIARGMEYLHRRGICHGNLNPSTILVRTRGSSPDGYLSVKISGVGLSTVKNLKTSTAQGATINPCIWFAPEVLLEQEQASGERSRNTEKADVYSFAMVCFELLTGKVPFEDGHLQGDKMSRNIQAGERPLFPFPTPRYLVGLTKRCWHADPSQRPGFSAICRVLRYIRRFLLLNPDHGAPEAPNPPLDYFDLEVALSRRFPAWAAAEAATPVPQVPFQMFAYRVMEKERTCVSMKERSSESGSDGASMCGDESVFGGGGMAEDTFAVPMPAASLKPPLQFGASDVGKKPPGKKTVSRKAGRGPSKILSHLSL